MNIDIIYDIDIIYVIDLVLVRVSISKNIIAQQITRKSI
jgi:hypothetical protein